VEAVATTAFRPLPNPSPKGRGAFLKSGELALKIKRLDRYAMERFKIEAEVKAKFEGFRY